MVYSYYLGKMDDGNIYKQVFEQLLLSLKDFDNFGFVDYIKVFFEDICIIFFGGVFFFFVD